MSKVAIVGQYLGSRRAIMTMPGRVTASKIQPAESGMDR
ncbi:hypothetical protein SAMN05192558_103310 [Actinokineospora alba]|uniref:Uncharacterized protein n=1 Tax=Actinokineospora alba TaxID=504798 RepID=A0A1H0K2F7_9PSEU|nr:hypothetical protein C8E96_3632 [Actinokineospora alba]SDH91851.1 hypothetical protein SAMN05421871_102739 [Actinokineospora alba]SDO50167.1 hypothetical protein SAMN05192558_103310 [Actinokineospora alba]